LKGANKKKKLFVLVSLSALVAIAVAFILICQSSRDAPISVTPTPEPEPTFDDPLDLYENHGQITNMEEILADPYAIWSFSLSSEDDVADLRALVDNGDEEGMLEFLHKMCNYRFRDTSIDDIKEFFTTLDNIPVSMRTDWHSLSYTPINESIRFDYAVYGVFYLHVDIAPLEYDFYEYLEILRSTNLELTDLASDFPDLANQGILVYQREMLGGRDTRFSLFVDGFNIYVRVCENLSEVEAFERLAELEIVRSVLV